MKKKTQIDLADFPEELRGLLCSGEIYDSSCHSGAETLYCDSGYYIKIHRKGELAREAALCQRFHRMGLGAEFVQYLSEDRASLVTR